jgi:hypothetical protein
MSLVLESLAEGEDHRRQLVDGRSYWIEYRVAGVALGVEEWRDVVLAEAVCENYPAVAANPYLQRRNCRSQWAKEQGIRMTSLEEAELSLRVGHALQKLASVLEDTLGEYVHQDPHPYFAYEDIPHAQERKPVLVRRLG